MQAKLDKLSFRNSTCYKTSEYYHIWLNPTEMMPNAIDCWVNFNFSFFKIISLKIIYHLCATGGQNKIGIQFCHA